MKLFSLVLLFLMYLDLSAQVIVSVTVDSTSSGTTCTDPFGLTPAPAISLQIEQNTYYYEGANCPSFYQTAPFTQYSNTYSCISSTPSTIQICMKAYEEDGGCSINEGCLVQLCQNYTVPAPGTSSTYSISIANDGFNASWGNVNITISATGSFLGDDNNLICDAIDLGILNSGSTLGNSNLSSYSNFCANNISEPSPWGGNNDQGVWFQFTTGSSPSTIIDISANSDPQNFGNDIDLQLALYESSTGNCNGTLTLIADEYQGFGNFNNEDMTVNCLKPNTTYFLLVDGENTLSINIGGQEGYFGLELIDNGILQAPDFICNALNLGAVTTGGTVNTPSLSQCNICAGNLGETNPSNWTNNQGVWYSFIAPNNGHVNIEANSDQPFPIGTDQIDLQLAVYSSSNGTCSGVLTEVASSYNSTSFDEDLELLCLTAGETYWVLVDGSPTNQSGIFDISISEANPSAVANTGTDDIIACDSLIWINGNTYYSNNNTATHTLNNLTGCDSVVTLNLTIINSATGIDTRTECDSIIWIDGNTYSANNNTATFNITSGAANLCDSLVTLDLTIINSATGTDTRTECDSFTWIDGNTYSANNNTATFNITGGAANLCDSLVTLDLTINTVNSLVTQTGTLLTADEVGATYQWLNCLAMAPIIGATNQSFTATTNGDYAVIVTNNGCTDTSNCYSIIGVIIIENNWDDELLIYPNPTDGNFSVDLGNNYQTTIITITDLNGRTIQSKSYTDSQLLNLKLEEPAGIYLLIIESKNKKAVIRLIKE